MPNTQCLRSSSRYVILTIHSPPTVLPSVPLKRKLIQASAETAPRPRIPTSNRVLGGIVPPTGGRAAAQPMMVSRFPPTTQAALKKWRTFQRRTLRLLRAKCALSSLLFAVRRTRSEIVGKVYSQHACISIHETSIMPPVLLLLCHAALAPHVALFPSIALVHNATHASPFTKHVNAPTGFQIHS